MISAQFDQFELEDIHYRIERNIRLLNQFNSQIKNLNFTVNTQSAYSTDCCSHALIKLCMKKMKLGVCINSVVETWSLFNDYYGNIEREIFLREFSSIVCAVFQGCVVAFDKQKGDLQTNKPEVTFDNIMELYIAVSSLPIVQILRTMDTLYISLKKLIERYGLQQNQTWSEWATINWWVPPVAIGAILWSILKNNNIRIIDQRSLMIGKC